MDWIAAAQGSGATFNRSQIEQVISSLGNRVFLMNNTHEDAPEIFQTRWALCYLRGPLTRDQIKMLMDPFKAGGPVDLSISHSVQKTSPAAGIAACTPSLLPCPRMCKASTSR